ncbi:MAG: hypothetical protein Q9M26_01775 [Mariprofundales bacterium]|nr:hypothetical protein [Mariprofundales bacterium]
MTIRPSESRALRILQQNSRSHEIRFVRAGTAAGNAVDQVSISGQAKQMAKGETPASPTTPNLAHDAPMPDRYTIPKHRG